MKNQIKLALVLLLAGIVVSCNEVDIKLINQIKTFGPKWSAMGEKLNFIDRNLTLMEGQFELNYSEYEPILDQIPDSLRGRKLRRLLTGYSDIVSLRDSIRKTYKVHKKTFLSSVEAFNSWERKVMDGDIKTEVAYTDLRKFKQSYGELDTEVEQMKAEMNFIANDHNRIFRGLASSLDKPTSYNMVLK